MTRILVVDDDKDQAKYLTKVLQGQGWEVGAAYDGAEALVQVKESHWNVVLMDIRMPNQDGLTALQPMHQHDPNLPVILLIGDVEQGDILKAYRSGAYECLLKPVDEQDLVKTIQQALARPEPTWSRTAPSLADVKRLVGSSK
jgi:CheY-like chemotaxis protein